MFQIEHPDILKTRQQDNFKIIENSSAKNRLCYVYFSSNGLYFPNDAKSFTRQVLKNDRYEWENLYNDKAAKNIFVRDVFKQWYFEGISDDCNSIEQLAELLKELTEGYEVRCVGISAGGYAALLFGYYLGAEVIYAFAPQFSILDQVTELHREKNPLLVKYELDEDFKSYFDISWVLDQDDFVSDFFYFYPAYSDIDQKQSELIENKKNVTFIPIKTAIHGVGFHPVVCREIIRKNTENLLKLFNETSPNHLVLAMLRCTSFCFAAKYFAIKIYKKTGRLIKFTE